MSHALFLQHDAAFGPGRLLPTFRDFGIPTRTVRLDHGEPVPSDPNEVRVLVLLGGPQRLTEPAGSEGHPEYMNAVIDLTRVMVEEDRPTLGIGLGAQILAKAGRAEVKVNTKPPAKEGESPTPTPFFGWGTIKLPFPGGTDPMLFGLHDGSPMFWFQHDTLELPKLAPPAGYDPTKPGPPPPTGNALLCSSAFCKNAAFRFKNRLYGFQFHFELTADDLTRIYEQHSGRFGAAMGSGALDRAKADTAKHAGQYARLGDRMAQNVVQFFKAYEAPGR